MPALLRDAAGLQEAEHAVEGHDGNRDFGIACVGRIEAQAVIYHLLEPTNLPFLPCLLVSDFKPIPATSCSRRSQQLSKAVLAGVHLDARSGSPQCYRVASLCVRAKWFHLDYWLLVSKARMIRVFCI